MKSWVVQVGGGHCFWDLLFYIIKLSGRCLRRSRLSVGHDELTTDKAAQMNGTGAFVGELRGRAFAADDDC